MSLSPAIIEAMLAAGATAEVLAAAMKADIAEREAVEANRRAKGAERTRRSRERNTVSRDVTLQDVTQRDVTETPTLSRPPNENISNPPTHTHPDQTTRARKAHRLPNNWQPSVLPIEVSEVIALWPEGAMERELSRFRDWAASAPGKSGLKTDWHATWRNWLRRRIDEGTYQNGRGQQQTIRGNSQAGADKRSSLARAIDESLGNLGG